MAQPPNVALLPRLGLAFHMPVLRRNVPQLQADLDASAQCSSSDGVRDAELEALLGDAEAVEQAAQALARTDMRFLYVGLNVHATFCVVRAGYACDPRARYGLLSTCLQCYVQSLPQPCHRVCLACPAACSVCCAQSCRHNGEQPPTSNTRTIRAVVFW